MHSLLAVGGGFLAFLLGCLIYAAGASVLFAWGGLVVFAGLAAAAALFIDTAILSWAALRQEDRAVAAPLFPPRPADAPPRSGVEVVVEFLTSWRYCPLARSENASARDLEDAALQLLDALAEAERTTTGHHVRVARELLRQAAPAIRAERSTRLDGPLMSVLDALDELEKTDAPDAMQTRLDKLYRRQLLLRRLQLFPVEWIKVTDAQAWMGVTEREAEEALEELRAEDLIHVDALGRWALNSEARREAIESPLLDLPVDAVEERQRRSEMEGRVVVAANAAIDQEELLSAFTRLSEIMRDGTVFEWADARGIDSGALMTAGDMIAEVWSGKVLGVTPDTVTTARWNDYCASYAYAISIGIEVERHRRDSAELPA